ncbi:MAG: bifunctional metallophosphatase/5'-nucleotidase [Deltaproteobacteria bacterium]|jgi:2',3'-cyclic-nucleotide 2'-phosphodiesterase (5'-nucleotidase family)|nr:bifunctional metallophosphatase/5'-nucleotidase [Deltaproteobacteria bacterium]
MQKTIFWPLIFTVLFFALAIFNHAQAYGATPDLVIYHTNDVHGYAFEERDSEGKLVRIGYDRLKAVVDADPTPRKLLLDAGDVLHGQAFATARLGELMGEVLSLVRYDAIAAGNHDFDYGYKRLLEISEKYRLNFLAANIVNENNEQFLPPYVVRAFTDFNVGIFGLSTPETKTSTDPRNIEGLDIKDPVEKAKATVELLKAEGADLIIAVMHMGSMPYCKPMSQTIAEQVPGIDIIIDGHSHSKTTIPIERSDGSTVTVASTGSYFENLGKITVDRKISGGFSIAASIIEASSPEIAQTVPDPAMREAMRILKAELDKEMAQVVMKVPFDLDGSRSNVRRTSTNLGRLVCASLAYATGADVALMNGGAFRDSIPKGDVTKGHFLTTFPYGNYVYLIEVTGEDIMAALTHGLGLPGGGAFPQFWGMEVETEKRESALPNGTKTEIMFPKSVKVGGKPLDPKLKYSLAINDFIYSGGDGYVMFGKYPYREFATMEEVFRTYMEDQNVATLQEVSDASVLR